MRGAPQSGFSTLITPDQYAQLRLDPRSPSRWARLPTPAAAKSGSVQRTSVSGRMIVRAFRIAGNQRHNWTKNRRSRFVSRTQPRRCGSRLSTDVAASVLGFKPQLRLEWRGQDGQSEAEKPDHPASLSDSNAASQSDEVFGTQSEQT